MDGTRNYLRNRREEMIDAIIKGKEDIERYESNGPGDAVAESAEDQAEAGEAMLDEDKKISSWVDTASKEGREAGGTDQDKDIKTRFPASDRREDLFK